MSTRCNIVVKDKYDSIQLYRHCDGYPDSEHGVIADLKKALEFAWPVPRMEAKDFSAAIVAAWKDSGGGSVYIDGTFVDGGSTLHGDIKYLYIIEPSMDRWAVKCYNLPSKTVVFDGYIGDDYD